MPQIGEINVETEFQGYLTHTYIFFKFYVSWSFLDFVPYFRLSVGSWY